MWECGIGITGLSEHLGGMTGSVKNHFQDPQCNGGIMY